MAIFNNNDHGGSKPAHDTTTIITEGAAIVGEMKLDCNLYVDGSIEGRVETAQQINVGKNGTIKGDVFTNNIIIQGRVEGSIDALRVEIKALGRVEGSVTSKEFIIESQGIFEGESHYKKDLKAIDSKPEAAKSATKKVINP